MAALIMCVLIELCRIEMETLLAINKTYKVLIELCRIEMIWKPLFKYKCIGS